MTPGIPPPLAFPRHRPDNDLNVTPRFQRMFRSKVIAAQRFRILDLVSRGQESPATTRPIAWIRGMVSPEFEDERHGRPDDHLGTMGLSFFGKSG